MSQRLTSDWGDGLGVDLNNGCERKHDDHPGAARVTVADRDAAVVRPQSRARYPADALTPA
jgi:hypothetical protein